MPQRKKTLYWKGIRLAMPLMLPNKEGPEP